MLLKRKSIVYIITAIILIAIFVVYLSDSINKQYGNDKASIEKVIKSLEGYENQTIEILEIKDIYDQRVVAFLSNNNPAYIQFYRNQKGNYEWRHLEKSAGESFVQYLIHVTKDESNTPKFMIVTNGKSEIAKMKLGVNGQVIEQEFNVNKKSVTWIELPKSNSKTYTFNYKYYDKGGNLIESN